MLSIRPRTCSAALDPRAVARSARSRADGSAQRLALLRRRRPALALLRRLPARARRTCRPPLSATAGRSCCCRSRGFAGPNLVSRAPGIVLFNTLVLLPVALLCVYGIAARIAGRLFGYFAAALWIALPYLGILFVEPGYHQKYTELTLPQATRARAPCRTFPRWSAAGLGISSAFGRLRVDQLACRAAAGLAAGYSIAIKPSNAIFLFAPRISCWS